MVRRREGAPLLRTPRRPRAPLSRRLPPLPQTQGTYFGERGLTDAAEAADADYVAAGGPVTLFALERADLEKAVGATTAALGRRTSQGPVPAAGAAGGAAKAAEGAGKPKVRDRRASGGSLGRRTRGPAAPRRSAWTSSRCCGRSARARLGGSNSSGTRCAGCSGGAR